MACLILVPECLRQLQRSLEVIVLHRFVICNLTKQIGPDVVLKFGWVDFFFIGSLVGLIVAFMQVFLTQMVDVVQDKA